VLDEGDDVVQIDDDEEEYIQKYKESREMKPTAADVRADNVGSEYKD
jgi:hypothetical protein